jgi:hypothetical protein
MTATEGPLRLKSAGLLLDRLGIDLPEEIDVEAIAQACGATVVYEPLQGCEARIVGVRSRAVITVNTDASRARHRAITLATVRELAAEFQTSLTATAIRLVELGSYPALVVCSDARRRRWFVQSHLVPEALAPRPSLHPSSIAWQILSGRASPRGPVAVPAHAWTAGVVAPPLKPLPSAFEVMEDSVPLGQGLVLSLVWWKDESQIVVAGSGYAAGAH